MNCSRLYHVYPHIFLDSLRFSAILGILRVLLKGWLGWNVYSCRKRVSSSCGLVYIVFLCLLFFGICEDFYVRVLKSFKLKRNGEKRRQEKTDTADTEMEGSIATEFFRKIPELMVEEAVRKNINAAAVTNKLLKVSQMFIVANLSVISFKPGIIYDIPSFVIYFAEKKNILLLLFFLIFLALKQLHYSRYRRHFSKNLFSSLQLLRVEKDVFPHPSITIEKTKESNVGVNVSPC